ncbi:DUF2071 domain-containing protein [Streptomyces sp. NPDC003393]
MPVVLVLPPPSGRCSRFFSSGPGELRRTGAMPLPQEDPEPITADPPHTEDRPLFTQSWFDLTFLHWAVEPGVVAPLLPAGTRPDTLNGVTYVQLVAFRRHQVRGSASPASRTSVPFPRPTSACTRPT